ncbi:MAG: acetyl-CoA carboxylase biotin carboxyl carrier protein subunit [Thermodesulfobacteriota bacterium]
MSEEILAPLAGKIVKSLLKIGDKVEEDGEAFIIEAMKMETPVYVPCDGTVQSVNVKVGDEVAEDDILAVIE